MKVLFSGRFDPPHPGHIISIRKLALQYGHVDVVILDYPERDYSIAYTHYVFEQCFSNSQLSVRFLINKVHFGEITKEQLKAFNCDAYAGGNHKVLSHVESLDLGIPILYIDRSADYSASKYERP